MAYKDLEKKKVSAAAWYKANSEKEKARATAWQKANPEKTRASCAAWVKANLEKIRMKQARQRNPGLPEELLAVIVMKNMIRKEIKNQTNQTT